MGMNGWRRQLGKSVRFPAVLAVIGFVALFAGCDRDAASHAVMTVRPRTALLDSPVTVSLRGMPAGARVTVEASAMDSTGTTWKSAGHFVATSAGTMTLDQPSSGGSYTGRNPMGLFESMTPSAKPTSPVFISPARGYDVSLQAKVDGQVAANATTHRHYPTEIDRAGKDLRLATDGINGELYTPRHAATKRPAVLVFGGSEGGLGPASFQGPLLAAHGYPTLALAYFKAPGLPQTLANIPLEYFRKALEFLRAQPGVDPHHVLVMGGSRGAEAALLLGSHYPNLVNGVIAGAPTSVVQPGFPDSTKPAWTQHGKALPSAVDPNDSRAKYTPNAIIPVEKIAGPLLLACGGKDPVWPSCRSTDVITGRLSAHHFRYPVTALRYPDAGHSLSGLDCCYSETAAATNGFGGSPDANRAAGTDAYAKLLAFLKNQ
jgi:dienelactone hydrolase